LIPEQLLSSSSINQKKHKDNYTNIQFFSDKSQALEWLDIKTSLHNVVAYFQPVVLLDSRNVIGYEALARKVTKNKVSAPIDWLPQLLAEKGGSQRLTHHMLEYVLNILPKIPAEHYVSVNFEIEDLVDDSLNKILYRFKNESSLNRLVVEIAERGEVSMNTTHIAQKIKKLKMRIALDDFGAGSSRFLSLIDFKPEVIKLDKIVTDRLGEKSIQKFVKSLSEWGNENNTKLLAEGIEYEEQINDCLNAGVVLGQGYFFGKPSPWQ
ncbi:MAG: EAL domain-containing protein, partial [Colwellia sp.]